MPEPEKPDPNRDWLASKAKYAARVADQKAAAAVLGELDALRNDLTAQEARRTLGPEQCCENACNGGACESCNCCAAGWCVLGIDGLPADVDGLPAEAADLARWIEVAREHNPIVEALAVARARIAELERTVTGLQEEKRQLTVACQAIGEGARSGYIPRAWEGDH